MCNTARCGHPVAPVTALTAGVEGHPLAAKLTRPDPSSFANHDQAKVTDVKLDMRVNFDKHVISGVMTATIQTLTENAPAVVFDINKLTVDLPNVKLYGADGIEFKTNAAITNENGPLGQALVVPLPETSPAQSTFCVAVPYSTHPESSALQWLTKEQTAGKRHPYLFTQSQAIHGRAFFPCQDTPGVKAPYTASVTTPAPLQALMSAIIENEVPDKTPSGDYIWRFKQAVPVPSYLVALTVGDLVKKDIGPRSCVWAEKEQVEAAAYEFAETEQFLAAAESICGPYDWGRYDINLMPPSYNYGGMEHPCLTNVTPTLLAGDRSLANVVAHEIAHSWMGNLVTNSTWESFFLNEGFTVFVERKIIGLIRGKQYQSLHAMIGWEDLKASVQLYGEDHPFTCLQVTLGDADPDDAFSSVPYEKGFTFLCYLEKLIGGPQIMEEYLKAHCRQFRFKSISTNDFKSFFLSWCKEKGVSDEILNTIDWDTWLYKPGMPPTPEFDTSLADEVTKAAATVAEAPEAKFPAEVVTPRNWSASQTIVFLDALLDRVDTALAAVKNDESKSGEKEEIFKKWTAIWKRLAENEFFNSTRNSEIRFRWLTLGVRSGVAGLEEDLTQFLSSLGRMKFVRPLYRDLFASARYREFAQTLFSKVKSSYHNVCAKMVENDRAQTVAKPTLYA